MGPKAFRNQAPKRSPRSAVYWRRRFLALVVGFGLLSVVAWAFSGALAVGRAAGSPAGGSSPRASLANRPGSAVRHPGGAAARSASPAASTDPAQGRPPAGKVPAAPPPGSTGGLAPGSPRGGARPCRPGSVVLSLFTSQDRYGPGQLPVFDVDVVSTSARTCAFNLGPKFLVLVITSGGARIWSSADCVAGPGSLVTDLVRGVPAVLPVSWGRQISAPGCAAAATPAPGGSYVATARHGRLVSKKVVFRIS
jgi:hypothetical protein